MGECLQKTQFLEGVTQFCKDVIEIVPLTSNEFQENRLKVLGMLKGKQEGYRQVNKVLVTNPNQALALFENGLFKNMVLESIFVDKVDMHLAMNLGEDLVSLGKHLGSLSFKAIISGGLEEKAFLEVKDALFNHHKALIIKANQDFIPNQSKLEGMEHFYILC
mmetsp:Transcript_20559/g.19537  ORF Transcript_20559/g.19537 Transcript_20559/m.19537 type:complete len:163 (+) Transcript_20559:366-854(+)